MSSIQVRVTEITEVRPHSNADALELATVGGWQMVVKKGAHQAGDRVVYFEQGTVLPEDVAERFGVRNYLSERTDINGDRVLVVHRVRLRGEPSFGLAVAPDDSAWELGRDVADHYGARKYYPPVKVSAGDAETDHPGFPKYTDIENMRSYPSVILPGEEVVATEKIHGSSARVGFVVEDGEMVMMAGSRTLRRRRPDNDNLRDNIYWYAWTPQPVQRMMAQLRDDGARQAVLYGEVYGKGIQSYQYGLAGTIHFRAFDLMIDGQFVDYERFYALCTMAGIEVCPLVYRGGFDLAAIAALSDGPSLVGGDHGREGVVVRPVVERRDPQIGRVILKYVGDSYLFSKSAMREDTTDQ